MKNYPDHMSTVSISSLTRRRRRPSGKYLRLSKNSVANELNTSPPSLKQFTFCTQRKILKPQKSSLSSRDNHGPKTKKSVTFTVPVIQNINNRDSSSENITTPLVSAKETLDTESDISKLESLCFEQPHISPREQEQNNKAGSASQNVSSNIRCNTAESDFAIDKLFSGDDYDEGKMRSSPTKMEKDAMVLQEEIRAIDETIRALKKKRKDLVRKQRVDFWHGLFEGKFFKKTERSSTDVRAV